MGLHYALNCTIFDVTVAPLIMPDSPARMSIFVKREILTSALLSPRPGWNRKWCYHRSVPKPLCESHHGVVNTLTVQSDINPRATVASIKVLFRGIKASNHTRFALSHARALGILPVSQINATVRAAFVPDSTLEFLPIFSSSKCTKASIFSGFLHSLQWFDPQKRPQCFQA